MTRAAFAVLFAVIAVFGGALLAAAELSTVYEVVVGALEIVRVKQSGSDQHFYALLILAAATVPLALRCAARASRPADAWARGRVRPAASTSRSPAGACSSWPARGCSSRARSA